MTLPPYTRAPITLADGTPVGLWSGPVGPVPVLDAADAGPDNIPPEDRCEECGGWGWFTETRIGSDDRDVDWDDPCRACDQTGLAS